MQTGQTYLEFMTLLFLRYCFVLTLASGEQVRGLQRSVFYLLKGLSIGHSRI
jgi:hypothetical protein